MQWMGMREIEDDRGDLEGNESELNLITVICQFLYWETCLEPHLESVTAVFIKTTINSHLEDTYQSCGTPSL